MSGAASEEQTVGAAQQAVARAHGAMVSRTAAVRAAYPHLLGVAYGTAPRQTYDLYLPRAEPAGPVLVFLHGGGFRAGEAGEVGDHGLPYLQAGGIFLAMGCRLRGGDPDLVNGLVTPTTSQRTWVSSRPAARRPRP